MSDPTVPGFDVVEMLGFGSGGEVWLARDQSSGEPVALKRLRPGAGLEARDRLRREAAVLAGVTHPHVVRLRSVVGAGDDLVLVLDLAPGGSLARLVAGRGPLSPGEVVTVAVPLAQALADVHTRGLVHGDVTPANVLFAADGRPLLSDLGVSRLLGEGATAEEGTVGFLDPAVLAGGPGGPAADVHGLAATCVAALTGTAPYDHEGVRVPPPAGSHPILDLLHRVLAADPADRPGAAELACAVWEAAPAEPVRLLPAVPAAASGRVEASEVPVTHRVRRVVPPPAVAQPAGQRARRGPRGRARAAAAGAGRRAAGVRRRAAGARRRAAGARPRSVGTWRAGLAVAGAFSAVTLAVVTGIAWAGAGDGSRAGDVARSAASPAAVDASSSPTGPPPSPTPSTPDDRRPAAASPAGGAEVVGRWAAVLDRLDASRAAAFAAGSPSALEEVYVPGSPANRRDESALRRLARSGLRVDGLRLDTVALRVLRESATTVRLQVTDVLAAHRLVDRDGAVVQERAGRGEATWTVTLSRVDGRWRVYDVARG